jgi:UMF1 family MFS transporter
VPKGKSSEFFAFLSVFQKFAGIVGPFLVGWVAAVSGSGRYGILALVAFFIGGMLLLSRVDFEAGRRAAQEEDGTLVSVGGAG